MTPRWFHPYSKRSSWVMGAIATLATATIALAQPPSSTPEPKKPPQRTVSFEMRDQPWEKVLEFLSDNSGLPVITNYKPQGTINFYGTPKKKEYTIAEVIDAINEALIAQKYVLIRRPTSIIIVPADEPQNIDQSLLPRLTIEDLEVDKPVEAQRYGRTELAQVVFPLNTLSKEEAERDLKGILGPFHKLAVISRGNKLLVTDTVGNLRRVKKLLDDIDTPSGEVDLEVLPLGPLDGASTLKTLQDTFGIPATGARPANAPSMSYDQFRNTILIRGTADQIKEARTIIQKLGGPGTSAASTAGTGEAIRLINLERGDATQVIENLLHIWQDLRANPIELTSESQLRARMDAARKTPPPARPMEPARPAQPMKMPEPMPLDGNVRKIAYQPEGQLADPRQDRQDQRRGLPGRSDMPVLIAPLSRGNGLMIASQDQEALVLAEELIRYLMQNPTTAGAGNYVVIPVRYASATDVARVIDELFNGRQQRQGGGFNPLAMMMGGGRGGGMFGGGGEGGESGRPAPSGASGTVRVVADPRTNSLLVRAPALELATIRRLLELSLDAPESDAAALSRTYLLSLKHASATEVASVLRDLYRDFMSRGSSSSGPGGFPGFGFSFRTGGSDSSSTNGNSRSATLAFGVHDSTNTLIVSCPEPMYKQIESLVNELDKSAESSKRTIKVVRINNVDPAMMQQAIAALTGQRTSSRTSGDSSGQSGGSFNQGSSGSSDDARREFFRRMMEGRGGGSGGDSGSRFGGGGSGSPGGFQFRGSGFPGGGGRRPDNGRPEASLPGGPGFFADRVMDDPKLIRPVLFDPQVERVFSGTVQAPNPVSGGLLGKPQRAGEIRPVAFQPAAPQPPAPPPAAQPEVGTSNAPRRPVSVESVPGTDQLVIIGDPADVEEIIKIIDQITKLATTAETEIRIFPLENADSNSVVNTLREIFRGVVLGPGATTRVPGNQQLQQSSVVVISLPRQNAVLVAAPRGRMKDIEENIKKLDLPIAPDVRFRTYALQKASATQVAEAINQFYSQRFAAVAAAAAGAAQPAPGQLGAQGTQAQQSPVVVQADTNTNSVIVQAGPSDQEEIARLIKYMDTPIANAVNTVRIVPLKSAVAADLAETIRQAILDAAGGTTTGRQQQQQQPFGGGFGQFFGQQQGSRTTTQQTSGQRALRFVTQMAGGQAIESGLLEGVRITPDTRTNALIVSAPAGSMDLILALIKELDIPPSAQSEVKVFTLKKADATSMAQLLYQLFYGTGAQTGVTGTAGRVGGTGIPSAFGQAGAFQSQQFGGAGRGLTLGATTSEAAPTVDLRIAIDQRTNSLIVAGSRSDLILIEALITRLDETDIRERRNEVYRLRNANATDVANSLTNFLRSEINVLGLGELTPFTQIEREVVVVAEATTNNLIISATPRFFEDIMRLVQELDQDQPQVVIQVLIAEVRLTNTEEFGVELGLQSPVLFDRSIIPYYGLIGPNGSVNYTTPPTGSGPSLVPGGVTVNNSINPAAFPGYNFNNSNFFAQPLPSNPLVNPGALGSQGLTNFNLGRSSAGAGVGGFVFSAASDSVNLLVRALKVQGRLDVLSRPQITAYHNQPAQIQVGQIVPIVTGVNITPTTGVTNIVEQTQIGILLNVVPRVSLDGHVIMQVQPVVSSLSPSTVNLGNGATGTIIDTTQASTFVSAMDGQTVLIGGLITRRDDRQERKVPWIGDLPYIGACFRFRSQVKEKRELIILLTPRVVRNCFEARQVMAEESNKMDWFLRDVEMLHAPLDLGPNPHEGPLAHPTDGSEIPWIMQRFQPEGPPGSQRPMVVPPKEKDKTKPEEILPRPLPVPGTAPAPAGPSGPSTQAPTALRSPPQAPQPSANTEKP